jgi:hypothetical protein
MGDSMDQNIRDKLEDPDIEGRVEEAYGDDERPQRAVELMMIMMNTI